MRPFLPLLLVIVLFAGCDDREAPHEEAPRAQPALKPGTPSPQTPELDEEARELLAWAELLERVASEPPAPTPGD